MDNYWTQVFQYIGDGRYSIDNIAEMFIRPLVGERKNSLFFIPTGWQSLGGVPHSYLHLLSLGTLGAGILQKVFPQIVEGETDYGTLLPQTIDLTANKC